MADGNLFPVKPNMLKLFDGRNVATRPIPVYLDSSDIRAINVAAADQTIRAAAVNMPSRPSVAGVEAVFGTQVAGATRIAAGVYAPASGADGTI